MIVKKTIKQKIWMLQSWQNDDKIKRCEINVEQNSEKVRREKIGMSFKWCQMDLTINMQEGENKILIKVYLWIVLRQLK